MKKFTGSAHSGLAAGSIALGLMLLSPAVFAAERACETYVGPALSSLNAYEGLMHEHSAFSDGDPQSVPEDYFRIATERGYSFVGGSEHSDTLDAGNYASLHASCDPSTGSFDPFALEYCFLNPTPDKLQKWNTNLAQARTRSTSNFLAIRGFEWTSDVFGHINVYFSQNFTNAKSDGGFATTMQTFWDWFTRAPSMLGEGGSPSSPVPFGGGADALAHFNHPHDKCLTKSDPSGATVGVCDWNDYQLIPAAVERMFGIEAYNDGNRNDRYQPHISRALDKGWRLSFVGSEDEHFAQYAVEQRPKTVTLATEVSEPAFKSAWLARRTYALSPGKHLRVAFDAEGHPMGSQLRCTAGKTLPLNVRVTERDGSATTGSLRLFSNGGVELSRINAAQGTFQVPVLPGRHWYFVRAHGADGVSTAYVAPVWVDGGAPIGNWLAGDMHVHTDHSSDGSAPRQGGNQMGPGNVSNADQIGEAQRQGLNWLPLTDHRTYDQHYDPLWESSNLLLIPGEEANGSPHCTIHGAVDMVDQASSPAGSAEFRSVQQSLWSTHAQGGVFVVAHPDDGELNGDGTPNNRANLVGMDSMEAWNRGSDIETEMAYAENRWNKGFRFGINGASDDHFKELWGITSPGMPRTETFATQPTERGILQGMRAGRFMLRLRATDPFVSFDADFDGNGVFEALQGDEVFVPAGTAARLRIRVSNAVGANVLLYLAPGRSQPAAQTYMPLATEQTFFYDFVTAAEPTWFRVEVRGAGEKAGIDVNALQSLDFATIIAQSTAQGGNERRAVTSPIFISTAPRDPTPEQAIPADMGNDDGAGVMLGELRAFAGFPAVAESEGLMHVVAEQHGSGTTQVFYRRSDAQGLSGPVLISGASAAARFPKVAAQGQQVWVVWEDERAGQIPRRKAIYLRHSADGGLSWDAERLLRSVDGRAEHPVIAATADGRAVVAWAEIQAGKPFDVWAQLLGVDALPMNVSGTGKIFAAASLTDTRSARYPASVWPALAVSADGRIALSWQDNRTDIDPLFTGATSYGNGTAPDNWQIKLATRFGSALWTAGQTLGANDRADRHPAIAFAADGRLVVAWDSKPLSASGPNLNVLAAVSSDNGQGFASAVLASGDEAVFAQRPTLARSADGGVRIAWFDNRSADWRWRIATSALTAGNTWAVPELLLSRGINTWPTLSASGLVFASTRNAERLQRDATQQIVLQLPSVAAPEAFNFVRRENVPLNAFITSERVTITGFTGSLPVSISAGSNAQISVNGGPFTHASLSILAGQTLMVRHVSSSGENTETTSTVTVGGYSTPFTSVTTVQDRVPNPYDFGRVEGQLPGALVESADQVLSGYNVSTSISAGVGAEYSLDSGASWSSRPGTFAVGAKIKMRLKSNSAHLGFTKGYLLVGGVRGNFVVRTR